MSLQDFERTATCLSELIRDLIPEGKGCVLVAGIGNEEITSDAMGPKTASGVIATRHIKKLKEELYHSLNLSETVVIQTGVMGTTGLESAEVVSSLVEKIKPKCVIAVDSLASRRLSRLATTVQISNAGISPGAGVANRRLELNSETIGVPVIAIGIPTVVDAFTLVWDLTEGDECRSLCNDKDNFYVAPKDSDRIIKDASRLLSSSINMAIHGMNLKELEELR
jgi:spore protease